MLTVWNSGWTYHKIRFLAVSCGVYFKAALRKKTSLDKVIAFLTSVFNGQIRTKSQLYITLLVHHPGWWKNRRLPGNMMT